MNDLVSVFDFAIDLIRQYIALLNSNWLTQIFLYLIVLSLVVSTILLMRGGK